MQQAPAQHGRYSTTKNDPNKRDILGQGHGSANFTSAYKDQYRGDSTDPYQKVTRHDVINKNYIFPQDKFNGQSSYTYDYPGKEARVKTEKVAYHDHDVIPRGKFEGTSDYLSSYIKGPGEKRDMIKHQGELKIGGKFQGQSKYLTDFTNKDRVATDRVTPVQNDIFPHGKFQDGSSYGAAYQGEGTERSPQMKQKGELEIGGQFYGQSKYNADYMNNGVQQRQENIIQPQNQVLPEGQFQSGSTYSGTYIGGPSQKQGQFRPEGNLKVGEGQFKGESSYGAQYVSKSPERAARVVHSQNEVLPKGRFDGNSSYGNTYLGESTEKRPQYKREAELKLEGKFEGNSAYAMSYQDNAAQRQRRGLIKHGDNKIMPEGHFQAGSTYQQAHTGQKTLPSHMIKHDGQLKVGGKFEGNSSYLQAYENNDGSRVRRELIKHGDNKIMPQGQFQAGSTYQDHHTGEKTMPSHMIRHNGELKVGGKFEGDSSYHASYDNNQGDRARREQVRHPDHKFMPEGQFQAGSTYQDNHKGDRNDMPSHLIKHDGELKIGGKFEGNSAYALSYQNNEGSRERRGLIKHGDNKIMPEGQFQAGSTYQDNHKGEKTMPSHMIKHDGELKIGGKFEGNSAYALSYENNEGPRQKRGIIKHGDNKFMPEGQFQAGSTYQDHHKGDKNDSLSHLIRHQGQLKIGGKFEGDSSYHQAFDNQDGPRQRRGVIKHGDNKFMPQGQFQSGSTYQDNHKGEKSMPSQKIKHDGELKVGGKFEGHSNYAEAYFDKKNEGRQQRATLPHNEVMPKGNFQGVSSYGAEYIGRQDPSIVPGRRF